MDASSRDAPGEPSPDSAPAGYAFRVGSVDDVLAWSEAIDALHRVNGTDGIYFAPYSPREPLPGRTPERLDAKREHVGLSIATPKWLRFWLAFHRSTGAIAGHVDLRGPTVSSELHRCTLGLGVTPEHHRKGLGRALVVASIAWARSQESLAWIDLGVFGGNGPARALYSSLGFEENGITRDRFRIDCSLRPVTGVTRCYPALRV